MPESATRAVKAARPADVDARHAPQSRQDEEYAQSSSRVSTFVICFLVALFEGADLQSLGVTAGSIIAEFKLSTSDLGILGAASSLGLFVGAALCGRASDIVGRKVVLVASVALFGAFSFTTPVAFDLKSLALSRFLTGLGLGGGTPMLIAIGAEIAPLHRRTSLVALFYMGVPLGAALITVVALFGGADWRNVFYFGGFGPLALVVPMILFLKESPLYRAARRAQVSRAQGETKGATFVGALFGDSKWRLTAVVWFAFLLSFLTLYLILVWFPILLVDKGLTRRDALVVQIAFNLGAAVTPVVAWAVDRFQKSLTLAVVYLAIAASLGSIAMLDNDLAQICTVVAVSGLFVAGAPTVLYGLAADCYPTASRGTGVGAAVAMGRLGSVLGPLFAGYLVGRGMNANSVIVNILPIVVAAGIFVQILLRFPRQAE